MKNNEQIVQLLYRRIKKLPLTQQEHSILNFWLQQSECNRKILESLSDENWLEQVKERYYAPGKEAGLQQLREQLFNNQSAKLTWWQRVKKRLTSYC